MIYKYRELNNRSIGMVANPELYFALPETLNDPLELNSIVDFKGNKRDAIDHLKGYLDALNSSYRREFNDLLTKYPRYIDGDLAIYGQFHRRAKIINELELKIEYANGLIDEVKSSSVSRAITIVKDFYESLLKIIRGCGICSLAGQSDNELMWAHYGDEHRGICFEFEDDLFDRNRLVIKRKVNYNGTGVIDAKREGYLHTFEKIFCTKSTSWAYEDETRCFIFGDPRPLKVSHRKFPAIILGYRFFSTQGLSDENLKSRKDQIKKLHDVVSEINKRREKGMKLKIKRVVRDVYSFKVQSCDTGKVLEAMRSFPA